MHCIVPELTHKQKNMGVPLPRGLRCQGCVHSVVWWAFSQVEVEEAEQRGGEEKKRGSCWRTTAGRDRRREGGRPRGGDPEEAVIQRRRGDTDFSTTSEWETG